MRPLRGRIFDETGARIKTIGPTRPRPGRLRSRRPQPTPPSCAALYPAGTPPNGEAAVAVVVVFRDWAAGRRGESGPRRMWAVSFDHFGGPLRAFSARLESRRIPKGLAMSESAA